ncbi:MAG: hypothetical protein ACYDEF_15605 [Methanosarcina sp.]
MKHKVHGPEDMPYPIKTFEASDVGKSIRYTVLRTCLIPAWTWNACFKTIMWRHYKGDPGRSPSRHYQNLDQGFLFSVFSGSSLMLTCCSPGLNS